MSAGVMTWFPQKWAMEWRRFCRHAPPMGGTLFHSELSIHFSTRLPEFYRFFLHAALQRLGFRNVDLRGVIG